MYITLKIDLIQNYLSPQLLMSLELITLELLATYALTH